MLTPSQSTPALVDCETLLHYMEWFGVFTSCKAQDASALTIVTFCRFVLPLTIGFCVSRSHQGILIKKIFKARCTLKKSAYITYESRTASFHASVSFLLCWQQDRYGFLGRMLSLLWSMMTSATWVQVDAASLAFECLHKHLGAATTGATKYKPRPHLLALPFAL